MIGTHEFHLRLSELNAIVVGEMIDMINCLAVYNGAAKWKQKAMTYEQVIMLR